MSYHSTIYLNEEIFSIPGAQWYDIRSGRYLSVAERIVLGKELHSLFFFYKYVFSRNKDNDEIISTEIIPSTWNIRKDWRSPIVFATSAQTCIS